MFKTNSLCPETTADALIIESALADAAENPLLQEGLGPHLNSALTNARVVRSRLMDESFPTATSRHLSEVYIAELAKRRLGERADDGGPPSMPGSLADIMAEPELLAGLEPRQFTREEAKTTIFALRRVAANAGSSRSPDAVDLLGRLQLRRRPGFVAGRIAAIAFLGIFRQR